MFTFSDIIDICTQVMTAISDRQIDGDGRSDRENGRPLGGSPMMIDMHGKVGPQRSGPDIRGKNMSDFH